MRELIGKNEINLSSGGSIQVTRNFFLDTRVYQLTVPDLPLTRVYNRDQVPMALATMATQFTSTIDVKNKGVI